jgi:acylphosphatase
MASHPPSPVEDIRGREAPADSSCVQKMAIKRVHIFYSGRVQGVGFRYTAEALAQNLDITGWVSNLRDGRVELLAEGAEADIKDALRRISEEMSGYIKDVDISWEDPNGEFGDFRIRFQGK